jgi:hypothetical protein
MFSACHAVEIDDGSIAAWILCLVSHDSKMIASVSGKRRQWLAIMLAEPRSDYSTRPGPEPNHEESQEL